MLNNLYQSLYRGFVPTYNKGALIKYKLENNNSLLNLEQAKGSVGVFRNYKNEVADGFAGVFNDGIVMIDFDDLSHAQRAFELSQKGLFKTPILRTTKGFHFYFKQNPLYPVMKCCTRVNLTCGLQADIKVGHNAIDTLAIKGQEREWLNLDGELQSVPDFLLPCKRTFKSYDLDNPLNFLNCQEGRNDKLYNHVTTLLRTFEVENQPYKQRAASLVKFINSYIFSEPLADEELNNTVLRTDSLNRNIYARSTQSSDVAERPRSQIFKIIEDLKVLGEYKYDTFTHKAFYNSKPVDDNLITELRKDMTVSASAENVLSSVNYLASANKFDSMNNLLDGLPMWDGVPRCEHFFGTYCGADDDHYTQLVAKYFWTMLYRRAYGTEPVQADTAVVLKGEQGIYKSTLIEMLGFHFTGKVDFKKKYDDNVRAMQSKIICEVAELKGMSNADVNDLKDFLSEKVDRYTPKFSNFEKEFVRRCVFVMTTNESNFLRDVTGNRRYAIIEITGRIDLDLVSKDLFQLWAEAKTLSISHEEIKEMEKLIQEYSFRYMEYPAYYDKLAEKIDNEQWQRLNVGKLWTTQFLAESIGIPNPNKVTSNEIAKSMRMLGYTYGQKRIGSHVRKVWIKK